MRENDVQVQDATLEERIRQKVNEIGAVAEFLPTPVIVHRLPDFTVHYMSPMALKLLGRTWDELKGMSKEEYHDTYFNPEDAADYLPKILGMLEKNTDEVVTFFQQVRTAKDSQWEWYMSSIRIVLRDSQNQPVLSLNIAQRVDPDNPFATKAVRLLEENEFIRKHFHEFTKLGKREVSVLRLLALGQSAAEIAATLHISVATAETHRKNIRTKLRVKNQYQLSQYARAFDLI
jgi:DNA-binding CsgD family transcriptional regulator